MSTDSNSKDDPRTESLQERQRSYMRDFMCPKHHTDHLSPYDRIPCDEFYRGFPQ